MLKWENRWPGLGEWPHLMLLLLMAALSWYFGGDLPDRVPIHYNMQGEVDGYGSKWVLLLLMPGMSILFYLLLKFLPRLSLETGTTNNFGRSYDMVRFIVLLLFAGLHAGILIKTVEPTFQLRYIITPLFALLFILLGWQMPGLPRNGVMGIRTTWTLANDEVWKQVHRAARPVMIVGGLLYIPLGFISEMTSFVEIMALAVGLLIWSLTYSHRVHNRLSSRL